MAYVRVRARVVYEFAGGVSSCASWHTCEFVREVSMSSHGVSLCAVDSLCSAAPYGLAFV